MTAPTASSTNKKLISIILIHKQKTDSSTSSPPPLKLTHYHTIPDSSSSSPISKPNSSLSKPSISSITLFFLSSFLLNIKELVYKLRESNSSYSYLFARKFAPDYLRPLMEITDDVIFRDWIEIGNASFFYFYFIYSYRSLIKLAFYAKIYGNPIFSFLRITTFHFYPLLFFHQNWHLVKL